MDNVEEVIVAIINMSLSDTIKVVCEGFMLSAITFSSICFTIWMVRQVVKIFIEIAK